MNVPGDTRAWFPARKVRAGMQSLEKQQGPGTFDGCCPGLSGRVSWILRRRLLLDGNCANREMDWS